MRKLFRFLPMIALLAAPLTVFGGTNASMQVSFTVLASCTVDGNGATAPAVNCMQANQFVVSHRQVPVANPDTAAAPIAGDSAAGWTIYF